MVPDLDLQIQGAMKALADTVAPAVDPANRMAVEQLGLAIATLAMVRARLPLARRMARKGLDDALALAAELAAACGGIAALDASAARGRAVLADAAADTAEIDAVAAEVKAAIAALLAAEAEGSRGAALDAVVFRRCGAGLDLRRAWNLPAGFEPYPERLPTIESLLA